MSKSRIAIVTSVVVAFTVFVGWLRSNVRIIPGLHNADPTVVQAIVIMLGIIAAAVLTWIMSKKDSGGKADKAGSAGAAVAESTDLDDIIGEAEARLADAENEKDAKLRKLPAIFLIGDTASAKTTTMVRSGLDPELLAGQVYEEANLLPTPAANFWFARHTIFVETAGKLLGDNSTWTKLVGTLSPSKIATMLGAGEQPPRAALVCVDAESITNPDAEAVAASARALRTRLSDLSQLLGINLPVYVLFTKTDRLPFFNEYVRNLNNEEFTKILGATLPIVNSRQGLYAEEESTRLSGVFERLFRSLCHARPTFLSRENDPAQLPGIYEFPREFRKLRQPLVRFLVEVCRPSQLTVGPFLRGFYFSGVRPVIVNEVAPVQPAVQEQQAAAGRMGATGMFRYKGGPQAGAQAGQRIVGTRKVPQWLFLGHFFNDLILADTPAKGASTVVRANMPRRIMLLTAAALCLICSIVLTVSFARNRALETRVKQSAREMAAAEPTGLNLPSVDSLRRLEGLRQTLNTLLVGLPMTYHFGLYAGDAMIPDVRKLYFENFRKLLLNQTQAVLVDSMKGLPATPGPEYGPTYDTLKAYLITTSNHDKSTRAFLPPVLLNRWSANRNVDPERLQLAQKQFDFYSDELKSANPFSSDNDGAAVEKARRYLSQFAGLERVYQAMLADAAKTNPPLNFNKKFPGSAEEVIDSYDVAGPFTKPGWEFMKASLKNPDKYFSGEQWVLGNQGAADIDRSKLGQQLAERYYSDFIKQWRAYLKAAAVVKYASLPDASKKLGVISGNQSPLLALFWLASQNTAVDKPEVANVFQPVQTVVPPSSVDRYIAPPNQSYMNALVALQAAVETASTQTPVSDATANQTLGNATNAKVAARQVAQAFRIDPDAHVEGTVQKLMEDPITYTEALLRSLGPAELSGKGKGLCALFRALMSKYPFNPSSNVQATVADVNGVLKKPDGALWKFYDENLQKLLPKQGAQYVAASSGGVNLNPAFVNFFNQAAALSEFLYAGGSQDPHFTYTLKPVPSEGIQAVGLQLDGQSFTSGGGAPTPKQFVWQGSGTHEAKASVKFGGGSDFLTWAGPPKLDGLWAVFQFFNKAEQWRPSGNAYILEWVVRTDAGPILLPDGKTPLTVRFELDMGPGNPQVFQKGYFSRFTCVSEVAKP